jgi:trans-aconitate methyltransferase
MPEDTVSWSRITGWRAECFRRYGSIHQTPVVDISAELKRLVGQATSVLDFGAGVELPLRAIVDETKTRYRSLDSDPEGTFDFSDISDVPHDEHFDLVVANQVMEHIPLADDLAIVRAIADRLSPGGRLAITVPSASHPVRHWADVTHVTHRRPLRADPRRRSRGRDARALRQAEALAPAAAAPDRPGGSGRVPDRLDGQLAHRGAAAFVASLATIS